MTKFLVLVPYIIILSACTHFLFREDRLELTPATFAHLNNWQAGDKELKAFQTSCQVFSELPVDTPVGKFGKASDWQNVCRISPGKNAKDFFEENFKPYLASNSGESEGLFTGYHEMELRGSLKKEGKFIFPLYRRPLDLVEGQPYMTREVIDKGALSGKGLELVYLDDPVKLYFLHIQGSGLIYLRDGSTMRVGYAAKNNLPYFAIGKFLAEEGHISREDISADSIKYWLYANPDKAAEVMQRNPSYIFFRELEAKEEAIGAQGKPLTPEVSLAVDKNFIPLGVPLWVETSLPDTPIAAPVPFERLMIAQDTGSAITGPVRGDIFFGRGDVASTLAGYMKQPGRYFLLIPKTVKISQ